MGSLNPKPLRVKGVDRCCWAQRESGSGEDEDMEGNEEEDVAYDDDEDEEQADVEDDEDMGLGNMQVRCGMDAACLSCGLNA